MKKHPVLSYLVKHKQIKELIDLFSKHDFSKQFILEDTTSSLKSALTTLLWEQSSSSFVIITSHAEQASELYFDLSSMIDEQSLYLLALPEHHIHLLHEDIDPEILKTVDTLLG
ncbi:MAG: hypothetical protein ACO323_10205, partial [Candidatus Kapaibacteriota bacterium]